MSPAEAAHELVRMGVRIIGDEDGETVIAVPFKTDGLAYFNRLVRELDLCNLPLLDTWGGYWGDPSSVTFFPDAPSK